MIDLLNTLTSLSYNDDGDNANDQRAATRVAAAGGSTDWWAYARGAVLDGYRSTLARLRARRALGPGACRWR